MFSVQCGTHTHFMAAETAAQAEVITASFKLISWTLQSLRLSAFCSEAANLHDALILAGTCCQHVVHVVTLPKGKHVTQRGTFILQPFHYHDIAERNSCPLD